MRMKKFREILALLPASDDLQKVQDKLSLKAARTKSFILKAKKIGRYLLEIYLIISYLLQTLGFV